MVPTVYRERGAATRRHGRRVQWTPISDAAWMGCWMRHVWHEDAIGPESCCSCCLSAASSPSTPPRPPKTPPCNGLLSCRSPPSAAGPYPEVAGDDSSADPFAASSSMFTWAPTEHCAENGRFVLLFIFIYFFPYKSLSLLIILFVVVVSFSLFNHVSPVRMQKILCICERRFRDWVERVSPVWLD